MIFTPDLCKEIEIERQKWPDLLVKIEVDNDLKSYADRHGVIEVWASKHFRLRIVRHEDIERITVHRMTADPKAGTWEGNISWDELQELKHQCGRGHMNAFEWFPEDGNLINNGNYRHLWLAEKGQKLPDFLFEKRYGLSPSYDTGKQADILKASLWNF